jgi:queuine/archaeosine tRNA-ribosyltransferase
MTAKELAERDGYVRHILRMRKTDADLARHALVRYHNAMPWLEIMAAVRVEIEKDPRV